MHKNIDKLHNWQSKFLQLYVKILVCDSNKIRRKKENKKTKKKLKITIKTIQPNKTNKLTQTYKHITVNKNFKNILENWKSFLCRISLNKNTPVHSGVSHW